MKTKLGISVGLLGAATYFMGLFSGYMVLTLLAGYILFFETNEWLRKTAVKAFVICVFFSVISACVGFIPNAIELIDNIFYMFDGTFDTAMVSKIVSIINVALTIAEKIILLVLGFKALKQDSMGLGVIDSVVEQHTAANAPIQTPEQPAAPAEKQ